MSSCAEVLEFAYNFSSGALKCMDNYDKDSYNQWKQNHPEAKESEYNGFQYRKDSDFAGLITALEASQSGEGGLAMVGVKVGGNIMGSLGGLDMTTFNQVMDNSINGMLADKHSTSNNEMNVIGSLLHGAQETVYLVEDRIKRKKSEINNEEFLKLQAQANDPNSPYYDPYFDCRYEMRVSGEAGKYGSTLETMQLKDFNEALSCIRERQAELAEMKFTNYMKDEYGTSMSYSEWNSLPASERPSIEDFVFPSHKAPEEIINETSSIEDLLEKDKELSTIDDDKKKVEVVSTCMSDLEILENTRVNSYKFNSYKLTDANKVELDKAVNILLKNENIKIELLGHSCDIGDKEVNYTYGILRAKEAKAYLVEKGVDAKRISVHSMSCKRPLVPNNSSLNRALNRRVEIKVIN